MADHVPAGAHFPDGRAHSGADDLLLADDIDAAVARTVGPSNALPEPAANPPADAGTDVDDRADLRADDLLADAHPSDPAPHALAHTGPEYA